MTPLTFMHFQSCRVYSKYSLSTSRLSLVQIMQKLSAAVRNVHEMSGKGAEIQLVRLKNEFLVTGWKLLARLVEE